MEESQKKKIKKISGKTFFYVTMMLGIIIMLLIIRDCNKAVENERKVVVVKEDPNKKIVRRHVLEITQDMILVSDYIRSRNNKIPTLLADTIAMNAIRLSDTKGVPESIIIAIIMVESTFNPARTSHKGAKGLMQIYDEKCGDGVIDKERIYEIDYNMDIGVCILLDKLKSEKVNGDLFKALVGYVGGKEEYANDVLKWVGDYVLYKHNKLMGTKQKE